MHYFEIMCTLLSSRVLTISACMCAAIFFILFFDRQNIEVLNMLEGRCHAVSVPMRIASLHMVSRYDWLLEESDTGA